MIKNMLKRKLKEGKTVFGTWSMTGSTTVIEVIGNTGLDFIILDMEHGSMSFETVENMVRAAECVGCQPIIRVSNADESNILRALETGSQAIMVPHISTPEQAARVVSACKYTPEGTRGLSPYTRNHNFTHENLPESMKHNNNNIFVGVLVEGKEGIANLESIAAVQGLDLIYTGIYDLSQSIGLPGELNHPKVLEIQKKCVEVLKEKGLAAGSFAKDEEYIKTLLKNNFQFIAYSVDAFVLKKGYLSIINDYKNILKEL
jgi:4-hydroxy-2-oxoheptanedioate aldolase